MDGPGGLLPVEKAGIIAVIAGIHRKDCQEIPSELAICYPFFQFTELKSDRVSLLRSGQIRLNNSLLENHPNTASTLPLVTGSSVVASVIDVSA